MEELELELEWRIGGGEKLARTKATPWLMDLSTGECWTGMLCSGEEDLLTTRVGVEWVLMGLGVLEVVEMGVLVMGLGRIDSGIWWLGRVLGRGGWLLSDLSASTLRDIPLAVVLSLRSVHRSTALGADGVEDVGVSLESSA